MAVAYGLTEHSTQFLDAVLRNRARGIAAPRYKTVPPWSRSRVLDPETLEEVPAGEIGLRIFGVSGSAPEDVGLTTGAGGVDGWFRKPLNPARLVEAMTATLPVN